MDKFRTIPGGWEETDAAEGDRKNPRRETAEAQDQALFSLSFYHSVSSILANRG